MTWQVRQGLYGLPSAKANRADKAMRADMERVQVPCVGLLLCLGLVRMRMPTTSMSSSLQMSPLARLYSSFLGAALAA